MAVKAKLKNSDQSARFRNAAKAVGGDQRSFEKAFKKIVPEKRGTKLPKR